MAYSDRAGMVARFNEATIIQLTDRTGTGQIDDSVVGSAIADADAEIDTYLVGRYDVPLDPVPVVIEKLSSELAYYNLHDQSVPSLVKDLRDNAIALLSRISTGTASLDVGGSEEPPGFGIGIDEDAPERVFTSNSLDGFM